MTMEFLAAAADISKVIGLSVAPVFLLTGISGALNVLSTRLGRIIDRGRRLNEMQVAPDCTEAAEIELEQRQLAIRAGLVHHAIRLCTISALFVCFVIIGLFLDALFNIHMEAFVATLFMVALGCLSYGLLTFLREISQAATSFHFGKYRSSKRN